MSTCGGADDNNSISKKLIIDLHRLACIIDRLLMRKIPVAWDQECFGQHDLLGFPSSLRNGKERRTSCKVLVLLTVNLGVTVT